MEFGVQYNLNKNSCWAADIWDPLMGTKSTLEKLYAYLKHRLVVFWVIIMDFIFRILWAVPQCKENIATDCCLETNNKRPGLKAKIKRRA